MTAVETIPRQDCNITTKCQGRQLTAILLCESAVKTAGIKNPSAEELPGDRSEQPRTSVLCVDSTHPTTRPAPSKTGTATAGPGSSAAVQRQAKGACCVSRWTCSTFNVIGCTRTAVGSSALPTARRDRATSTASFCPGSGTNADAARKSKHTVSTGASVRATDRNAPSPSNGECFTTRRVLDRLRTTMQPSNSSPLHSARSIRARNVPWSRQWYRAIWPTRSSR